MQTQTYAFGRAVVAAYQSGLTIAQVASKFGCHGSAVHRWMRRLGVRSRPTRVELDNEAIVREFKSGESVKALADRYGVARHVIGLRLRDAGLKPRSRSDAERLKWSRMTDTARAAQVLSAHESQKGRFEDEFADMIRGAGFPCDQQKPVGRYNLDIALCEMPVAVEVTCFPPTAFRSTNSRERSEFLLREGWLLIYIRRPATEFQRNRATPAYMCFDHVRRQLIPLLERARRDASVFGRYQVILSHPEYRPRLAYDFGELKSVA